MKNKKRVNWAAVGVIGTILLGLGVGDYFRHEIGKVLEFGKPTLGQQAPVQQHATGAGSVTVNGNGNSVSTNSVNVPANGGKR